MGQQEPHPTVSWAPVLEEAREEDGGTECSAEGRGVSGPPEGGGLGGCTREAPARGLASDRAGVGWGSRQVPRQSSRTNFLSGRV